MSIIKQIYNAKVVETTDRFISVTICVNGKTFFGNALCHPDDMDFCSNKVGTTIAHQRAVIDALKWHRNAARREWKTLKKAYYDAYQNKPELMNEDSPFRTAMWQAENRYHRYQNEVKKAREQLRDYLNNHEKAISSLRIQRSIAAKAKEG